MLKILHISDLHFDKDHWRDQRIVLKALFEDIESTVRTDGPYDLVFFTGDLIAKGGYTDANKAAVVKDFILPLIEAAEIAPDRLFLVPGNHDINLKEQSGLIGGAQKSLKTEDEVAKYLDDAIKATVATGLEGFNDILERIGATSTTVLQNNHYRAFVVDICGLKVGVAAINSAWHATGAPNDGDYGQLRVGRKQIDEIVAAISTSQVKFALMHHAASWLAPKDSNSTQRQLQLHFDGLFHGHNHEPNALSMTGSSSSLFASNAGCLYESRDYFNGYFSIKYNCHNQSWKILAREYFENRQCFDAAPRFGPKGEATFQRIGDAAARGLLTVPSDDYIESVHGKFDSRLLPALVSNVAPKSLKLIFVEPLLSRVSQRMINAKPKNGAGNGNGNGGSIFISLPDVFQSARHSIFLGSKDMGKTTILHRVCQLCIDVGKAEMPPFGAYVNLDFAGDTLSGLIEAIVSFGGSSYRKSEIIDLLQKGAIAVCFDNLQERHAKQFKAVREFCAAYQACRYFFTMHEDVDYSLSPDSVPRPLPGAEVFYIHPFGRKQTRLLTENWFGESADECAAKVDEILSLLGRLNIPRSPFLISALLWIREKQTQFSPVNQAEILDALIDGVMEKLSETKDRSRIDSTIKRHYLAALAEHLHNRGVKKIQQFELQRFTLDYFESRGLPAETGSFLSELKNKGILLEVGDEVIFMFDAIRAFFLSTRLHENADLLKKALTKEHFLELGEELDYYTGRHRDQSSVLTEAARIVNEFFVDSGLNIELSEFNKIRFHDPLTSPSSRRALRETTSRRPSAEQRLALLESVDEQMSVQPMSEPGARQKYQSSGVGRYLEALRIASSILRNSELVDDVALKQRSYSQFSEGWCKILIGVTSALDEHANDTVSISDSVESKKQDPVVHLLERLLPTDSPGMAKHLKKLIVPNVIISLAVEAIGTQKLQRVMEAHNSRSLETVQHFLDVFLMVDLRLPRWMNQLESLLQKHHKNRFICQLVFTKLFEIYMLGRLRATEEEKVKGMLSESIALMVSESRSDRKTRMKGAFLNNLTKRRLSNR